MSLWYHGKIIEILDELVIEIVNRSEVLVYIAVTSDSLLSHSQVVLFAILQIVEMDVELIGCLSGHVKKNIVLTFRESGRIRA